jgi:hypothetical protein
MRYKTLAALAAPATVIVMACSPPPAVQPVLPDPARCGQTQDGKAIVALGADAGYCGPAAAGKKLLVVDEVCGPLVGGSNAVDDCWRGTKDGVGVGNFRYGSLNLAAPHQLVATDAAYVGV